MWLPISPGVVVSFLTHIKTTICIPRGTTHLDKCACWVGGCYLWLLIIICMHERVFPTLLWLEFEYEKKCPWGYSALQATLTNNFIIGEIQTPGHEGDTGKRSM